MAFDVNEDWSGPQFARSGSAWTGQRKGTCMCTGSDKTATMKTVLDRITAHTSIQQNEKYKSHAGAVLSEYMWCESLDATSGGFGLWRWSARYSSTPAGRFPVHGSPLTEPIEYEWDFGSVTEQIDIDDFRNPIQNTNGEAFSSMPSKNFVVPYLTCRRNEPTYDLAMSINDANCVNQDVWIFGPNSLWRCQPGIAQVKSIKPMTPITIASPFYRIEYKFEFRKPIGSAIDSDGLWDSLKYRVANTGQRCFYTAGGKTVLGDIIFKKAIEHELIRVGQDVRLASDGKPIDLDSFGVRGFDTDGMTPVAAPNGTFPAASQVVIDTTNAKCTFLKYRMYGTKVFSSYGL